MDRARYESQLARRRFLRVDPDNRLVAASLESEWNSKLRALSEAEQNYERQCQADQHKIGTVQREQVLALATNFPHLWNDPSTADRERKRMVRLLIEDVTIRKGEQVQLDVRFRGGMSRTLMLPRPLSYRESHKQNPARVSVRTDEGSSKKRTTVGPNERQLRLRCPQEEFRLTTGALAAAANSIAGVGFTMWSCGEMMMRSLA